MMSSKDWELSEAERASARLMGSADAEAALPNYGSSMPDFDLLIQVYQESGDKEQAAEVQAKAAAWKQEYDRGYGLAPSAPAVAVARAAGVGTPPVVSAGRAASSGDGGGLSGTEVRHTGGGYSVRNLEGGMDHFHRDGRHTTSSPSLKEAGVVNHFDGNGRLSGWSEPDGLGGYKNFSVDGTFSTTVPNLEGGFDTFNERGLVDSTDGGDGSEGGSFSR